MNAESRTNNYSEAGHRKLQAEFTCCHPSLWDFISTMWRSQKLRDVEYTEGEMGRELPLNRAKYAVLDDRILDIVTDYENRNIIDYLSGIAHNL